MLSNCTPDSKTSEKFGWEVFPFSSYSPDLAPLNYHLFRPLKGHTSPALRKWHSSENRAYTVAKQWTGLLPQWHIHAWCSAGWNAWKIVGNSWNSATTSPVTQDGLCFRTYTFALIEDKYAHDLQCTPCIFTTYKMEDTTKNNKTQIIRIIIW
jgi:hypothetical protein